MSAAARGGPPRIGRGTSRRAVLAALALAALPFSARAQDAAVRQPIADFHAALEKAMRDGPTTPFKARFDALAPVVDRVFDLGAILSVSYGPRWAGADAGLKTQVAAAFRAYTVATYVANFDRADGEKFDMAPGLRAVGDDQVVTTRIVPRTGDPTRLDYLMRKSDAGWRVVDILVDGTISRVAVQRSDWRALLGRDGDAAALLANLRKKAADLSGGALN
jgi:phospholipid transport system substrate-binding protein